eukprot:scaffold26555_cov73-Isochrysis_galbana.AAC.2
MEEQALDNDEQINVRWAYDDPNPRAEAMRLRNNAQARLPPEKKTKCDTPLKQAQARLPPSQTHPRV